MCNEYFAEKVDVAVIGGGHAGIEAALASARLGAKTILFTISMDAVANLPCNPSIGGTAKGHLVREIDALGGEMGKVADKVTLQSRMLNRGKGPAVHSLRTQVDRNRYHVSMKQILENQRNLILKQAEIVEIKVGKSGSIDGVVTALGAFYSCNTVIICTGTFLNGRIFVGDRSFRSGPDGLHAPSLLSESLIRLGIPLRKFKTGTPARVHKNSIDFSKLEVQPGDDPIIPFSFSTKEKICNKVDCYIAYTNEKTHEIIRKNLHRSPLYSGEIIGIGPRYCPSIEDKIVRFPDKQRHQIFVEPVGLETNEMYLQGMSSSLPEDVQIELYRSVEGFENLEIIRNAYAIEYDCVDPLALKSTMEFKQISGLFGAGQFNGTSGYEEAAAQGLIAGINAVFKIQNREPFVLDRSTSYIGTLVDDLVTKGCEDPYRMMTSRSEYRLLLRQDNADIRLMPYGREIGLISDERWEMFHMKQLKKNEEEKRLKKVVLSPTKDLNAVLVAAGTSQISTGINIIELIRRPQITYKALRPFDPERPDLPEDVIEQVEIGIKYEGYIRKQMVQAEQMKHMETKVIPEGIDFHSIKGIRIEAREKLNKVRPRNIGQASRISGVSPSDLLVLLTYLQQYREKKEKGNLENL